MIEFPHTQDTDNNYPFVFIENKMIAEIFFDYAKNHVPAYHAVPTEDALLFLDELIKIAEK